MFCSWKFLRKRLLKENVLVCHYLKKNMLVRATGKSVVHCHSTRVRSQGRQSESWLDRSKRGTFIGRPFVKRFALCYQTVVCLSVLSCLSATFVHCGQMVGRIKMNLGMQVGLGPGHIVLDGDPAPPPPRGHSPHPIFGPYLLRPNGCMDQDAT